MLSQIAGTTEDEYNHGESDVYAQILKLPKDMKEVILLFYYEIQRVIVWMAIDHKWLSWYNLFGK